MSPKQKSISENADMLEIAQVPTTHYQDARYSDALVEIADLYTTAFWGKRIRLIYSPYIASAYNVIYGNGELYRTYLQDLVKQYGTVWGHIRSEKDIALRLGKFKRLVKSLRRGYDYNKDKYNEINGEIYGGITANKDMELIDGHHRVAILYVLGEKVVKLKILTD